MKKTDAENLAVVGKALAEAQVFITNGGGGDVAPPYDGELDPEVPEVGLMCYRALRGSCDAAAAKIEDQAAMLRNLVDSFEHESKAVAANICEIGRLRGRHAVDLVCQVQTALEALTTAAEQFADQDGSNGYQPKNVMLVLRALGEMREAHAESVAAREQAKEQAQ